MFALQDPVTDCTPCCSQISCATAAPGKSSTAFRAHHPARSKNMCDGSKIPKGVLVGGNPPRLRRPWVRTLPSVLGAEDGQLRLISHLHTLHARKRAYPGRSQMLP